MRGLLKNRLSVALLACAGVVSLGSAELVRAQGSYSPYNESPASALARYVRDLTAKPTDFQSLIGAGRAALELGDTQAAAGFFARADEADPKSPLPQAGMGAVQVANGDANAALPYFTRAQQLGATAAMLGCDRGLAYDLLGQQARAQMDYRAALTGADRDEARRRLALSLAISGDRNGAIATLAPLSASGDSTTNRVRAFVLALAGDPNAALAAINTAMPGSSSSVAPFLQRLPSLSAGQKAAAVNLGMFPDSNGTALAQSGAPVAPPAAPSAARTGADRLASIDALLGLGTATQPVPQAPAQLVAQVAPPPPVQVAVAPPQAQISYASAPLPRPAAANPSKIWLQLASGPNQDTLSTQFERLRSRDRDLFNGMRGYVAEGSDRARLVVGPFHGVSDAEIFADDLRTVGIDAFRWTSSDSDRIVPLGGQ